MSRRGYDPRAVRGARYVLAAAFAAAWLAGFAAAPAGASARPDQFGVAGSDRMHALRPGELARELDGMAAVGARWLRFDIDWRTIQAGGRNHFDWARFDAVVRGARLRGINVLGIIVSTPAWARPAGTSDKRPPTDAADYARFAGAVARRYARFGAHHWQIWNEPNVERFWQPKPSVAGYARLLEAAYAAIKRADPRAVVVSGGTAPSWSDGTNISPIDFAQGLYSSGAGRFFDALAHHASTFPAFPSETPVWSAWYQMTGTSPSIRSVMAANGDAAKPVWITEFGAPTSTGRAVSEATQAAMLRDAYRLLGSYRWAGPLFWYAYRDRRSGPLDWEDFCGLVRNDFSPKPAYAAYRALTAAARSQFRPSVAIGSSALRAGRPATPEPVRAAD